MKNSIRLAFAYLKYYKKQTLALFLGIVLSASLLTGIGSLLDSGRTASQENAREKYGDWHYSLRCDYPWYSDFQEHTKGKGYEVEKAGVLTVRKIIEEPFEIKLCYADAGYMTLMGRQLEAGHYPRENNEAAADTYTLKNLQIEAEPGARFELDGEEFILSGIISDMPDSEGMQVFVNEGLDYGTNGKFLYLKFDESRRVYRQMVNFANTFQTDKTSIYMNDKVARYAGGEAKAALWETVKSGISMEGTGFPYIWAVLNMYWNLTEKAVLAALGLFGIFIIYSLFQVSVIKRMSQYSIMQVTGLGEGATFGILAAELGMIFLAGYPAGCLLGNGVAALLYQKAGKIFVQPEDFIVHSGAAKEQAAQMMNMPDPGAFHFSRSVAAGGAAFLFLVLLFLAWILVRKMRKMTARELLAKDSGKRKNRKIYSTKTQSLTGVLTRKFMFARKGAFAGVLISLSAGSLIFLGTAYVTENTRINNELKFKADDGLGSDMQVLEDSDVLSDVMPEDTAARLRDIKGIKSAYAVRYMPGEISLPDGMLKWTSYYPEIAVEEGFDPDPVLMEKYNGIAVQTGEDDYKLKVNIYGYDDGMLEEMNEYLLEGSIDPEKMRKENTVILKTLMGGQGTYEGISLSLGDSIQLKTPVNTEVSQEVLKFLAEENQYREKNFKISALASRPLAKVDTYIGDDGTNRVDIIMTNEQMKENFGVEGYQTMSIRLEEGADAEHVSAEIQKVTSGIRKCIVKDYTQQIETQNLFLARKMLFFYGVALILLVISLLHIMNSMQYLVTARKHEFGIMRAMGITDAGFRKMLVKEGLRYGIYSSLVMAAAYLVLQKFLCYFIIHVYLYLHPKASLPAFPILLMAAVNIGICIAAVLISGQAVLKEQIIEEIRE